MVVYIINADLKLSHLIQPVSVKCQCSLGVAIVDVIILGCTINNPISLFGTST